MGNYRDKLSGVTRLQLALGAACLALSSATPARAADCLTGQFRAHAGPDVAAGLEIGKDGHFRYFMSAGAMDEHAQGRWTCTNGTLLLTTEPMPKPAQFKLQSATATSEAAFEVSVTAPNGQGIAGIDFTISFDKGEPELAYTQDYGWAMEDLDGRTPISIRFSEPYYGTQSPEIALPKGAHLKIHVVLEPNDMGTAAFADTPVTRADDELILHWRGGEMSFVRETR